MRISCFEHGERRDRCSRWVATGVCILLSLFFLRIAALHLIYPPASVAIHYAFMLMVSLACTCCLVAVASPAPASPRPTGWRPSISGHVFLAHFFALFGFPSTRDVEILLQVRNEWSVLSEQQWAMHACLWFVAVGLIFLGFSLWIILKLWRKKDGSADYLSGFLTLIFLNIARSGCAMMMAMGTFPLEEIDLDTTIVEKLTAFNSLLSSLIWMLLIPLALRALRDNLKSYPPLLPRREVQMPEQSR